MKLLMPFSIQSLSPSVAGKRKGQVCSATRARCRRVPRACDLQHRRTKEVRAALALRRLAFAAAGGTMLTHETFAPRRRRRGKSWPADRFSESTRSLSTCPHESPRWRASSSWMRSSSSTRREGFELVDEVLVLDPCSPAAPRAAEPPARRTRLSLAGPPVGRMRGHNFVSRACVTLSPHGAPRFLSRTSPPRSNWHSRGDTTAL
jgi:hypothetical protein